MALTNAERRELRFEERKDDGVLQFGEARLSWSNQAKGTGFSNQFGSGMDVDLAAFTLDERSNILDVIHFNKGISGCGGLIFSQDSHDKNEPSTAQQQVIEDDTMEESIAFDLGIISKNTHYIIFAALLNHDEGFESLKNGVFTLYNTATKQEILKQEIKNGNHYPACVLLSLQYNTSRREWNWMWVEEYGIATAFSQMNTMVQRAALNHFL